MFVKQLYIGSLQTCENGLCPGKPIDFQKRAWTLSWNFYKITTLQTIKRFSQEMAQLLKDYQDKSALLIMHHSKAKFPMVSNPKENLELNRVIPISNIYFVGPPCQSG